MKLAISRLTTEERSYIREAVSEAVRYWPNAHLGTETPSEDIRRAFRQLRRNTLASGNVFHACADLINDADRHADM